MKESLENSALDCHNFSYSTKISLQVRGVHILQTVIQKCPTRAIIVEGFFS
jgi:hypothetical protein